MRCWEPCPSHRGHLSSADTQPKICACAGKSHWRKLRLCNGCRRSGRGRRSSHHSSKQQFFQELGRNRGILWSSERGEFDPTTIMSFFYVFFFGMMLSDAAYGAILAIACFVLLKKFPRMSPGMYQSIKLFMFCGISTVIWGILFGGYFGNIVDVVSAKFFGTTITPAALWFIPLNDPMKLLVYSMLFGVIHLL